MKIAIANTMHPFVYGGAEILAESLKSKLIEYGHQAQIIKTVSLYHPEQMVNSMISARLTYIENADLLIGLKFPAYLIPHDNKKIWLLHQYRFAYDLAGKTHDPFSDQSLMNIKHSIIESDNNHLKQLERKIFTISKVVSDRLMKYNKINSIPLFPPLMNEEMFFSASIGDYIYYPSRVAFFKRQELLIEAMRLTKTKVKLILSGKGDTAQNEEKIFQLISNYNLKDKVTYLNKFISEKEKCDLYANCLGVAFVPLDEDYGYITIEAFNSNKPVITCTDSGCPAHFVLNENCGYIVEPTAQELASAMDKLYKNKKKAKEMGHNAKLRYTELNINWETVVETLVH